MDTYDLDDVTKAIKRAGAGLGWVIEEKTPRHYAQAFRLKACWRRIR